MIIVCVCVCVCVCVHTHTHKYTHTGFGQSGRTPLRARAPSAGGAGPTGTRNSTSLEARAANVSTSRRRMSEMWRPVEPLAHTFSKVIVLVHAPYKGTAESAVENLCIPGRFLGTIESLAAAPTRSCCGKTAVRGTHSQPSVARILNRQWHAFSTVPQGVVAVKLQCVARILNRQCPWCIYYSFTRQGPSVCIRQRRCSQYL